MRTAHANAATLRSVAPTPASPPPPPSAGCGRRCRQPFPPPSHPSPPLASVPPLASAPKLVPCRCPLPSPPPLRRCCSPLESLPQSLLLAARVARASGADAARARRCLLPSPLALLPLALFSSRALLLSCARLLRSSPLALSSPPLSSPLLSSPLLSSPLLSSPH